VARPQRRRAGRADRPVRSRRRPRARQLIPQACHGHPHARTQPATLTMMVLLATSDRSCS
jgi:hypothetical protein